jgi:hypothetical protein
LRSPGICSSCASTLTSKRGRVQRCRVVILHLSNPTFFSWHNVDIKLVYLEHLMFFMPMTDNVAGLPS